MKVQNDVALSNYNFHHYQKSECPGMSYRQLGKTSINVSTIAFDSLDKLLNEALRNGVNYIDTAYWYGQARSEELLGQVLTKIPRQIYYISTKIGRFELDFSRPYDYRAHILLEQLTMSLKRLKLTYVDILGIVNGAPLLMGLLTNNGPPEWHPAPSSVFQTVSEAISYYKSKGTSLVKLAIDYAIQFPGVSACLIL
uniref:Aldo_ket_red domain-containing protein n=1 Tax=Wuchereria bancrofti TaxID=6293 RepID=A0A1I8EF61_WUCBA